MSALLFWQNQLLFLSLLGYFNKKKDELQRSSTRAKAYALFIPCMGVGSPL